MLSLFGGGGGKNMRYVLSVSEAAALIAQPGNNMLGLSSANAVSLSLASLCLVSRPELGKQLIELDDTQPGKRVQVPGVAA